VRAVQEHARDLALDGHVHSLLLGSVLMASKMTHGGLTAVSLVDTYARSVSEAEPTAIVDDLHEWCSTCVLPRS